jgi:adenosylmethionine-8-amino-7-oxononanoate aminotransferase
MAAKGERWFTSGFTYSGHPVSCAAALKSIAIIEAKGLLENAARVGDYFADRLKGLEVLPLVGQLRGRRLMVCGENVASKLTKGPLPDGVNESKRISDAAEAMGLMIRPTGHLNVMSPQLVISEAQVDFGADTLAGAIRKVTDKLVREGHPIE